MKDKRNVPTGKTVSEASPHMEKTPVRSTAKSVVIPAGQIRIAAEIAAISLIRIRMVTAAVRGDRGRTLLLVLQGAIIGIGGILPGVSGGVLCVIFGLYQLVIEVLANPIANLKRHWRLIIPVGIGVGLGFMGCAGLVSSFMEKNGQAAVCVFVGLILGMIPDLWRDAGKRDIQKARSLL